MFLSDPALSHAPHYLNHRIHPSLWTSFTGPCAICTPQTETESGRLGSWFCTPNATTLLVRSNPASHHVNPYIRLTSCVSYTPTSNFRRIGLISTACAGYARFWAACPSPARSRTTDVALPQRPYPPHSPGLLHLPCRPIPASHRY